MRLFFVALTAAVLASCGGDNTREIDSTTRILTSTSSAPTTTTSTTTTVAAEVLSETEAAAATPDPTAVADPANQALGRTRAGIADFDGRATDQFYASGTTLSIAFPGELGPIEESDCFVQFEADVTATPDAVEIAIYQLAPAAPAVAVESCPNQDSVSEFAVELPEPLNGRPLLTPEGVEIPVSDLSLRRQPTLLPGAWEIGFPSTLARTTTQQFGPVTVVVTSANTRNRADRLEAIRNLTNSVEAEVGDGVPAVHIPRPGGTQRLSFVIDEWFYDLEAEIGTPTPQLFRFADSFEIGDTASALKQRWADGDTIALDNEGIPLTFYTRGNELVVGFQSIDLSVPIEDPCGIQFEQEIIETATAVNVVIQSRLGDAPGGCRRDPFITLPLVLDAPLGARTLTYNGITVGTTGVFSRIAPDIIPPGWEVGPDTLTEFLGGARRFGPTTVISRPVTALNNIEMFESLDHQDVDVLDAGDGLLITTDDGGHQLVFEDSGWLYNISAQPSVSTAQLIAFAQAFQ